MNRYVVTAIPMPNESFRFGKYNFDVYAAHLLLTTGAIKAPVVSFPVEEYKQALQIPLNRDKPWTRKDQGLGLLVGIDWDHMQRLTDADLERPGIVAETPEGDLLIDGNHRLAYAYMKNVPSFKVQRIPRKWLNTILRGTKQNIDFMRKHKDKGIQTRATVVEGDIEGKFTLGKINYDQRKGLGNVPNSASIKYMGFAVIMTPKQFAALAAPRDFSQESSIEGIKNHIKKGGAIASPFLSIDFFPPKGKKMRVREHEGRTRMRAILDLYGNVPVLVHVFPVGGNRAKHIRPELIAKARKMLIPERQVRSIAGPHFDRKVNHLDQWIDLDDFDSGAPVGGEVAQRALARMLTVASTADINKRYKQDLLRRIKTAITPLDFFAGDLRYIERFELLLQEVAKRTPPTLPPTLPATSVTDKG